MCSWLPPCACLPHAPHSPWECKQSICMEPEKQLDAEDVKASCSLPIPCLPHQRETYFTKRGHNVFLSLELHFTASPLLGVPHLLHCLREFFADNHALHAGHAVPPAHVPPSHGHSIINPQLLAHAHHPWQLDVHRPLQMGKDECI